VGGARCEGSRVGRSETPFSLGPLNKPLLTRVSLHRGVAAVPISLPFNSRFQNDRKKTGNVSVYIALEEIILHFLFSAHRSEDVKSTLKCLFILVCHFSSLTSSNVLLADPSWIPRRRIRNHTQLVSGGYFSFSFPSTAELRSYRGSIGRPARWWMRRVK